MAKKTIMSGVSGVTNNEVLKTDETDTVKTETTDTTEVQESEKVKLTDEPQLDNTDSEDSKDAEEFNKSDVIDKSDSTETQTTFEKIKEFLKRNSYNHLICGRYIQDEITLENLKKFYSEFLVYISSAEDYEFKELLEEYFAEQ